MKKINRFGICIMAVLAVGMVTSCGKKAAETEQTVKETVVETAAQTKAVETQPQTKTIEKVKIPVTIVNNAGEEMFGLYVSKKDSGIWDNDILGSETLANGDTKTVTFEMPVDTLAWDIAYDNSEGVMTKFYGFELSKEDAKGITLTVTYDGSTTSAEVTRPEAETKETKETKESETIAAMDIPVTITNHTSMEIIVIYTSPDTHEVWENTIGTGDGLADGESIAASFHIDQDTQVWDIAVENADGGRLEYYGIDVSAYTENGAVITLNSDGTSSIE